MSSVRACIVAYRSGERAVRAAASAARAGAEVVIVNNSPGDGLAERAGAWRVIEPRRNLGFAAGCNLAAAGATTDHLLFLNPDATIGRRDLEILVETLEANPRAAVAGPALHHPDGRPQPSVRTDPTAAAVLHQYTAFRYLGLFRGAYRRYRRPAATEGPVDVLMGSVLLVRRSVFEALGGFDPRYFMYYEEADLCRRARAAGHQVLFVPAARAAHEGGASAATVRPALAAERLISAQRYLRRFLSPGRHAGFRLAFLLAFPLGAMLDLIRDLLYLPFARRTRAKAAEVRAGVRLLTRDFFRVIAA